MSNKEPKFSIPSLDYLVKVCNASSDRIVAGNPAKDSIPEETMKKASLKKKVLKKKKKTKERDQEHIWVVEAKIGEGIWKPIIHMITLSGKEISTVHFTRNAARKAAEELEGESPYNQVTFTNPTGKHFVKYRAVKWICDAKYRADAE